MKARREAVPGYRYIVELSAQEREVLLVAMDRLVGALSIQAEARAFGDLLAALRDPSTER